MHITGHDTTICLYLYHARAIRNYIIIICVVYPVQQSYSGSRRESLVYFNFVYICIRPEACGYLPSCSVTICIFLYFLCDRLDTTCRITVWEIIVNVFLCIYIIHYIKTKIACKYIYNIYIYLYMCVCMFLILIL